MDEKTYHNFSARARISTVSFKCRYNTSFGSSLFVVGNLNLLGNWDINNAITLTTTPESYPVWTQKDAFSCPVGTEIIYKYFVKDTTGKIAWEILPNNANRQKIISKPGEFLVEDEENSIKEEADITESYSIPIKDIKPKLAKKQSKTKLKKEDLKKIKEEIEEIKDNDKTKEEIKHEDKLKTRMKKKKEKLAKNNGPSSSHNLSNSYKMDQTITNEKDDDIITNTDLKENQNLIDLKINLDKNFKVKDLYTYDINIINKMNSGLFESFLFNSNQNINWNDRLVFVDEFLPLTLKKNESCPEDDEENKYIIVPDNRYSSVLELVNSINCSVCWVGMLKNFDEFDEIELEEIFTFLEGKMIYVVEVKKKQYEDYYIYYNNILIPTFIDNSISSDNEYSQNYNKYYNSFQAVNRKFAETLCKFGDMNDLIMLNDMNLCFIPNALAQKKKINWRIGIYIHLCFPSSDVFKAFPNSIDIMYSLVLCDVIGFHIYQEARNFMTILERDFWIYPQIKNKGYITFDYLGKYSFIFIKYCGIDNKKVLKIISDIDDKKEGENENVKTINKIFRLYGKI